MMNWKQIYHNEAGDGHHEQSVHHLFVDFPKSEWNDRTESPVIIILFRHHKKENSWFIDREKTELYTQAPYKSADLIFNYFERQPMIKLRVSQGTPTPKLSYDTSSVPYDEFDIEYLKKLAVDTMRERLNKVLEQLK